MLFTTILLLALTNLLTLAVAARPANGEEGHTRAFSAASTPADAATPSMVPHYLGKGVVAHIPADAATNMTWFDRETGEDISKRSTPCNGLECASGVYICNQENFRGSCYWEQAGGGACHNYPYSRSSSFGVDMGLQCALFQDGACQYDYYADITWPGLGAGGLYGKYTFWNTKPSSYKCRPCVGCIYGNAPEWKNP